MIYFLSKRAHEYTWRRSLETAYGYDDPALRRELFQRVTLLSYEELFTLRELPLGSYLFADLERLTVEETERAARCWQALSNAGPPVRLFNHPAASMRRYELLRHLYANGMNRFDAQRLTEPLRLRRFPLFIRSEDSHFVEDMTPLLHNQEELNQAAAELLAAGKSRDNKIIVEYLDVRDESGKFHYFTACMALGEIIFMGHVKSDHWVVKALANTLDRQAAMEPYILAHGPMLRQIFRLANIDFGRIDYAVVNGEIQTFEINTNPTIGSAYYLLAIARLLDSSPSPARVPLTKTYQIKRGEPRRKGRAFRLSRHLHLLLRKAGLLGLEPSLLHISHLFSRLLKKMKRRSINRLNPKP